MIARLGRYEIIAKLGDGGFGSVYKAYDPTVGRVVAIKVLSTQGDATLNSRFHTEAMTAGNLHHKNIVTIYEFGEDNGAPFLAMEYLDGIDLQKIISNKDSRDSLTLLEKLEIMSDAAQGLQCAHENGIVHRDVKPANIMRLKDGSVKIMDFGIARISNGGSTRLTQTGLMIGTVSYMSPEQFSTGEADALCDVWSYGVVFYELLTGIHPFRADDPARAMYRIMTEEPPPLGPLVKGCPPTLEATLRRLLSKKREERIQSLEDFLLDAEPIISQLAKSEMPALLRRADEFISAGQLDQAQEAVARLLKLDRSNPETRQLRDRLRSRSRLQAVRPQIEELLREAEEQTASRNFPAALAKLNSALSLDPSSQTLRGRLERIQQEAEAAKRADDAVRQGRASFEAGDLTGAFTYFAEALDTDPGRKEVVELLEQVKSAMQQRELRAEVRAAMDKANSLIFIQSYEEAIKILSRLREQNMGDEQIGRRLLEAEKLRNEQEAKERITVGIHAARELLSRGDHESGYAALEELAREHPDNSEIRSLLTHALERLKAERLSTAVENLLAEASSERAQGRLEQALQSIQSALDLDRTSARALALQRKYLNEAQASRRKIDTDLSEVRVLLQQEKFDEALVRADRLAASYPHDRRAADARLDVTARMKERDEIRRFGQEATHAISSAPVIPNAPAREPNAPAADRNADAAGLATTLFVPGKEPRFHENPVRPNEAPEVPPEISRGTRSPNPILIGALAGGLIAVVAGAAIFWPRPVKPAELKVRPAEMVFSYRKGDPSPAPQILHVDVNDPAQKWTAKTSDNWLRISKSTGSGMADVETKIDPSGLGPGEYAANAIVSSPSGQKSLRVHLEVIEPPPAPVVPPLNPAVAPVPRPADDAAKAAEIRKAAEARAAADKIKKVLDAAKEDARKQEARKAELKAEAKKADDAQRAAAPPVNCHDLTQYHGLSHSTIHWKDGEIAPGARLTITGRKASSGTITGTPLPGCDVALTVDPAANMDVEGPSEGNGFRIVRITNKSDQPVRSIQIDWAVR